MVYGRVVESVARLASAVHLARRTAGNVRRDLLSRESPITVLLVLAICVAFLGQGLAASYYGTTRRVVTAFLFVEHPLAAWLLGGFLHRDVGHLAANVFAIGFLGRVLEERFSSRGYLLFLAGAAACSGVSGYVFQAAFSDQPVIAYGASGVGFALGAAALGLPRWAGERPFRIDDLVSELTAAEGLAAVVGLSVVATVVADLATGPYFTAHWVNGAHLGGVAFGLIVGLVLPAGDHPDLR